MSFGGGSSSGGRTRVGTKVYLNVYDLSPANDCLYPVGLGLFHSGVEIQGVEYSFGSGAGIFENTPKEAAGARFRESIELGAYEGGSYELRAALADVRRDFPPEAYHILTRNCNHFAAALVETLLRRPIPSYVNRLAYLGSCVSCFFPQRLLHTAPVGSGLELGDSIHVSGGGGRALSIGSKTLKKKDSTSFSWAHGSNGGGYTLGAASSVRTSSMTHDADGETMNDRREKARIAAMARLQQQTDVTNESKEN